MNIAGGSTGSFVYDALGRRENKTISGTATNFLYDGLNMEQELTGTTPTANYLTGAGIDEQFSRTTSGGTQSYLTDNLGSTLALTSSAGAIQTSYTYEPYGNTTQTGSASTNALQYTGRENDGDGLYYYRARYYSPTYGRFISSDPIGLLAGVNTYTYVLSNPISYYDPYGLINITYAAGFHVAVSPDIPIAVGPEWSSDIPGSSLGQNPITALQSDPTTGDFEIGGGFDAGVSAGIEDLSNTGGACAGWTVNFGMGKYAGVQITLRKNQDTSASIWNPLRYIDGISFGLGVGDTSPISFSHNFGGGK
jgi:RHS repeat-associated protein